MTGLDELISELWNAPWEARDEVELAAAERARRVLHGAISGEATDRNARPRLSVPGRGRGRPAGNSQGRWRSVPALGVGGLAVAAAAMVLITQVFVQGGVVQPQIAAAVVLERAAEATLASPPARLAERQYWYEEDVGTYVDSAITQQGQISAYVSQVERYWIGAQHWVRHARLVRIRPAQPITQAWQRAAMKMFAAKYQATGRSDASYDAPVSYTRMLAAPNSTAALKNFVLHGWGPSNHTVARSQLPADLFLSIRTILTEPMVPARLRAGLYRILATLPGVKMLGRVHDTLGRAAVAIGFADHDTEYELLFDPVSYALLDDRGTALTRNIGNIPPGTVQNTAFITSGLVNRVGQVPRSSPTRRP